MTALGIALTAGGGFLVWTGLRNVDPLEVIGAVLRGEPTPPPRDYNPTAEGRGGGMSPADPDIGGGRGSGGGGGGSF